MGPNKTSCFCMSNSSERPPLRSGSLVTLVFCNWSTPQMTEIKQTFWVIFSSEGSRKNIDYELLRRSILSHYESPTPGVEAEWLWMCHGFGWKIHENYHRRLDEERNKFMKLMKSRRIPSWELTNTPFESSNLHMKKKMISFSQGNGNDMYVSVPSKHTKIHCFHPTPTYSSLPNPFQLFFDYFREKSRIAAKMKPCLPCELL